MAAIKHFGKTDTTLRTGGAGNTSPQEVTQYTVAWSDLTTAGFANGDDVLIIAKANVAADSTTNNAEITWGIGSTFAGRAVNQTNRTESDSTNTTLGAREFVYLDRLTLATNDNFYVSIRIIATSTPNIEDFCFFIIKLGDLAADDFRWGTHTASGNQSTTPDDGASVTLPASPSGDDWLILAATRWLYDTVTTDNVEELNLDGNTRMQQRLQSEDNAETVDYGMIGYLPAAGSSAVCKVVKAVVTATTHDYTRSAIFALRMEAFADHAGAYSAGPVAMGGTVDTYVQTNTVSLSPTATGDVAVFGQTIADITSGAHRPYHRVQVDGADVVSGMGRRGSEAYGTADQLPLSQFVIASMSSASPPRVIDMDCAEDTNTTAYNFTDSTLVAFSMELAAAGQTVAIGLTTVTDSAFSVGKLKSKAIGLTTAADSAFALGKAKSKTVGLAPETDSVLALTRKKTKVIGLTDETDFAFDVTTAGIKVQIGLVEETDSVLAISRAKAKAIGLGAEADSAFAIGRLKTRAVEIVSEVASAFAATFSKAKAIGLITVTDSALTARPVRLVPIGFAAEANSAFSLGRLKTRVLALLTESDSVLAVTLGKALGIGPVVEADSAFSVEHSKIKAIGEAQETDTAFPVTRFAIAELQPQIWRRVLRLGRGFLSPGGR